MKKDMQKQFEFQQKAITQMQRGIAELEEQNLELYTAGLLNIFSSKINESNLKLKIKGFCSNFQVFYTKHILKC